MKLKFIFLGKKNSESFNYFMIQYLKRLNSYTKSEVLFFSEKNEIKLGKKVLAHIKTGDFFIILDERGQCMNTLDYAKFIREKIDNYDSIIFLVGGAFGVPKLIVDHCHYLISLSKMTFPHLIARLILLEQTYRAFTILNNHPYHHE